MDSAFFWVSELFWRAVSPDQLLLILIIARQVFTGGSGSLWHQQYKAAHVARKLFQQQDLDVSKIIFEERSRNTYENGVVFSSAENNAVPAFFQFRR